MALSNNLTTPLPLFEAYPALQKYIPYIALGNIDSTPIVKSGSLGLKQGVSLAIKNDGIYGTSKSGGILFSGNKRRKLEFLLADAQTQGAKHIYAQGGAGSNFATCTAAYAHELGLKCTLVLSPQRNTLYTQRNLKLDLFYGAEILSCHTRESRSCTCKALATNDPEGYFIPVGGSNKIGALGYVNAAFELDKQIKQAVMTKPDVIYITVSSAGMAAGLIVGLHAAHLEIPVKLVRIDGTPESIEKEVLDLIKETSKYIYQYDNSFPIATNYSEKFQIIQTMAGDEYITADHSAIKRHNTMNFDSYALVTPQTAEAIEQLYKDTGIKVDGTYAGKAFAACLQDIENGQLKDKKVLFWSSFCPGQLNEYTSQVDTSQLPAELQKYINEEHPLQTLDQGI